MNNNYLGKIIPNSIDIHSTGIYKIYHIHNPNIFYIGSASKNKGRNYTKGFYSRWLKHLYELRRNNHHSTFLQRIVNKYGIDNLRFEIVEICNNPSDIIPREQYYIDLLKPKYNTLLSASNSSGFKHSPETKAEFSRVRKGRPGYPMSENSKKRLSELGKIRDLTYLRTKEMNDKRSIHMKGKSLNQEVYNKMKKPVFQYTKDGILLNEYDSISSAAKLTNIDYSTISRVINSKGITAGGYKWSLKRLENGNV